MWGYFQYAALGNMTDLLPIISTLSPVIPLSLGNRNRGTLLWKIVLVGFFTDLITLFVRRVLHAEYIYIGNIYLLVEFSLLSILYNRYLFNKNKIAIAVQGIIALVYIALSTSTFFTKFNTNIGSIFHLAYITYALLGFYSIMKNKSILYIDKSMFFWINCGLLIYASGSMFLFLFSNYLSVQNATLHAVLWNRFFIAINIVTNLIWAKALRQQVDLQDE